MGDLETDIDRLYQLPLEEFTPARNALAKSTRVPGIKELQKPSLPAWAINQVYWRERSLFDRLVAAAEARREEHRKLIAGRHADVHAAERAHRDVVRAAIESARRLLSEAGQPVTSATLTAVGETLEALPAAEPSGRLARPMKPLGFEALAAVQPRPSREVLRPVAPPASSGHEAGRAPAREESRVDERLNQRAREEATLHEEARRRLQHKALEELKKAEVAMLAAETAVKAAEKTLQALRVTRDTAVADYQRARLRAHTP
jgi:hypothetical protein